MSILLTGGAGFIGSHTAVSLLNAGQDIVIVDNLYNSSPKVIDRIECITGKRPVFVEADCCDRAAMDRLFSDYDITGVIHFAGLKAVGKEFAMTGVAQAAKGVPVASALQSAATGKSFLGAMVLLTVQSSVMSCLAYRFRLMCRPRHVTAAPAAATQTEAGTVSSPVSASAS